MMWLRSLMKYDLNLQENKLRKERGTLLGKMGYCAVSIFPTDKKQVDIHAEQQKI